MELKANKTGSSPRIFKFCLTGGPCAGKSTAKVMVKKRFQDQFCVFFLPEMAETTFNAGVKIVPSEFTEETQVVFQSGIMRMQMQLEDFFERLGAIQQRDVIIICDRGVVDNLAYCTKEVKNAVLRENAWTMEDIRDNRYDAVIHLVTAADGAEEFYTLANNKARSETPEVARMLDKKTQAVWSGYPNFTVISNTKVDNFKHKLEEVYKVILRTIYEDYEPPKLFNYLIEKEFSPKLLPEEFQLEFHLEETRYLLPEKTESDIWIKKRINPSSKLDTFSLVRWRKVDSGQEIEDARLINKRHYSTYLTMIDKSREIESKEVITFTFDNHLVKIETQEVNGVKQSKIISDHSDLTSTSLGQLLVLKPDLNEGSRISTIVADIQARVVV